MRGAAGGGGAGGAGGKVLIINFFIKFIKSFVLVLFELFFSVIISNGLKRWFYEENTE